MPTQNVSANELLSAMPFPTTSPPTVQSSVSICVSYKLCVGKDTICRQIDVSPILDRGVVYASFRDETPPPRGGTLAEPI